MMPPSSVYTMAKKVTERRVRRVIQSGGYHRPNSRISRASCSGDAQDCDTISVIDDVVDFERKGSELLTQKKQVEPEKEDLEETGEVAKISCGHCSSQALGIVRQSIENGQSVTICIKPFNKI